MRGLAGDSDQESDSDSEATPRRHHSSSFRSPDSPSAFENEVTRLQRQFAGLSLYSSLLSEGEPDSEASYPLPPPPLPPSWKTAAPSFMPGASGTNTISSSTVHVVSGSQKITSTAYSGHNNYTLIHIENVNIHAGSVFVVGLFGQGDAMDMRCT
jgi:hypothetical protein